MSSVANLRSPGTPNQWLLSSLCVALIACGGASRGPLPAGPVLSNELRRRPLRQVTPARRPLAEALHASSVRVDPSDGLSPDEAALVAVAINPSLQAIRDQRGVAQAQVVQAGILPNPQLSASADVPSNGRTAGTSTAFGAGLSWDLTPLLSVATAVEAARLSVASVASDIAWREWQVAQSARLNAGRLIFIQRRLTLAEQSEAAFSKQVDVIRQALEQANATVLALSTAQSAMQRAQLTRLRVLQEQRVARLALLSALGVPPTADVAVDYAAKLPAWDDLPSLSDILKGLPQRRLDLRALQRGYRSQDAEIRTAVLRQFPALVVGVGHASDTEPARNGRLHGYLGAAFLRSKPGQCRAHRSDPSIAL